MSRDALRCAPRATIRRTPNPHKLSFCSGSLPMVTAGGQAPPAATPYPASSSSWPCWRVTGSPPWMALASFPGSGIFLSPLTSLLPGHSACPWHCLGAFSNCPLGLEPPFCHPSSPDLSEDARLSPWWHDGPCGSFSSSVRSRGSRLTGQERRVCSGLAHPRGGADASPGHGCPGCQPWSQEGWAPAPPPVSCEFRPCLL